ncbi:MAG: KR domain-containing protein [Polyangiaceae bacterium]|nr:KR domain-containing protein [Polyangiaceae bacterium]
MSLASYFEAAHGDQMATLLASATPAGGPGPADERAAVSAPSPAANASSAGPIAANAPSAGPVAANAPSAGPVAANAPSAGPVAANAPSAGPVAVASASGVEPAVMVSALSRGRAREHAADDAIAIIGMGAYLPRSEDLRAFWQHLIAGRDLVEEVPASRWDYRPWFDPNPGAVNKTYSKWGSFVDDVDQFDPQFFGIAPRVADWMDPQVRLLLQCAQQTFEDAGVIGRVAGSKTGVYVGSCYHEYWDEVVRQHIPFTDYQSHSSARSFLSATISYTFDLHGASIPLDNACASSLTALHLACQALRQGECDQALVAGVNLLLSPLHYVHFSRLRALSPSGRCHTFDAKADGYVPGEGVVSVLVKPLARALADGDNVHAVIRATTINHVGRANNPTSPRPELQVRMLLDAWAKANIDPRQIGYLEAHGTGTKLGDPIEINALTKAFRAYTADRQFCAIGSTKAHVGHLEGAAGLASIIKVILMMKHRRIPRMPNFERLNDYIDLKNSPFYINPDVAEWGAPAGRPRLAGVSAFGMTGNNAHVVLEEYADEPPDARRGARGDVATQRGADVAPRLHVIPLSAKGEPELRHYAEKLWSHLRGRAPDGLDARGEGAPAGEERLLADDLPSLAYTLQVGRQAFSHRAVFLAHDVGELEAALRDFLDHRSERGLWQAAVVSDEGSSASEEGALAASRAGERQVAERWLRGLAVDWEGLHGDARPKKVSLPTYPFRKQRYWMTRTEDMAAHPPPDIDPNLFRREAAPGEGQRPPQVASGSERARPVEASGAGWVEQAVPVAPREWSQQLADRRGQRVLIVAPGEETFRAVAQVFDRIDDILSQKTFEVTWLPAARSDLPGLSAAALARFGDHPPHLVLYIADDSLSPDDVLAHWRAIVDAFEPLAGPSAIHVIAVLAEPASLDEAVEAVVSSSRHRHTVALTDGALPFDQRVVLALNEWLWSPEAAALVDRRGGTRRVRSVPRAPGEHGFLRKLWRAQAATPAGAPARGACLVLVNDDSRHLLAEMPAAGEFGRECVVAFGEGGDVPGGVRLPFDQPDLLRRAVAGLLERHPPISAFVDLSDLFGLPQGSDGDKLGRFLLVQELVKRFEPLSIVHVTRGLQTYRCNTPSLAGARIAGLFRMLSAEYAHVRSKSIDLDDRAMNPRAAWRAIDEELRGDVEEAEILYRDGVRYVATIEEYVAPPAGPGAPQPGDLPVEAGGAYVISGGTGGVGLEIARYLAERGAGSLILMGETALPAREQWRAVASRPDTGEEMRAKLTALLRLEQQGVRLLLYAGDVADTASLRGYFDVVRGQCGRIRGVVHGAAAMRRLQETSAPFVQRRLDDMRDTMAPKVDGLHALAGLFADDALRFFVVFSSVAARAPQAARGLGDYAAANAYLEHFVEYQNKRGADFYRAVVWTGWRAAGSHARNAAARAAGPGPAEQLVARFGLSFHDNASGRWLFERALLAPSDDGVVWPTLLDRATLRRHRSALARAREPAPAPGNVGGDTPVEAPGASDVDRAFRRLIDTLAREGRQAAEPLLAALDIDSLSDTQVDELSNHLLDGGPHLPSAAVQTARPGDRDQGPVVAADQPPTRGRAPDVAPRPDALLADVKRLLGKELATVLRLDRDALSEHATFQSHGLDSISGTQLAVAIERSLGIDVSPAWLVEYATIPSLGKKLADELARRTA